MTWRHSEDSHAVFLANVSKALHACTGYKGNSQQLVYHVTVFDFGMQIAHCSFDDNDVHQVREPNEAEKANMIDNLRFEKRDESTITEMTRDAKIHKKLLVLFKESEEVKQNIKMPPCSM